MKQLRVLISRPDRVGDVVLSTPIPREIKRQHPDSYVAVLLRPYTKDIYLNNPYVDQIILFDTNDKSDPLWKKIKEVKRYRFTHALMLLPNKEINWLLFFAGIKTRIGVGHKLFQFLTFTKYVDRKKYIPLRHEADYCMDLARKIGIQPTSLDVEIHLTKEEKKLINDRRKIIAPNNEFIIGVHSTSGNSAPNWKPEEYLKLLLKLKELLNIKVILTDDYIPDILNKISGIIYPEKKLLLREFAILDLLISSSTGPMHVAAALKIKTISIFCPLPACSPKLWGPLGNECEIILPEDGYCSNNCPGYPKICSFTGKGGIDYLRVLSSVEHIVNQFIRNPNSSF